MAEPITWRNVTGGGESARAAMYGINAAGAGLNDGFKAFQDVIAKTAAIDSSNQAAQIEGMKQSFLNTLQSAKTPEELAAAQATVQSQFAALPVAVQAQVRGAEDARRTAVRSDVNAQQAYDLAQRTTLEAPIRDEAKKLFLEGKGDAGRKLLAENNLLNEAGILEEGIKAEQAAVGRTREEVRWGREGEKFDIELKNSKREAELQGFNLNEAREKQSDRAMERELGQQLIQESSNHQAITNSTHGIASEEASKLGLPIGADGRVRLDALTDANKKTLTERMNARGVEGVGFLENSDTAAFTSALDKARQSGRYTPAMLANAEKQGAALFSSSSPARIGNDKETRDRNTANTEAIQAEQRARYGVAATPENLKGYEEVGSKIISQYAAPGSWRYEDYMRQFAKFMSEGGYKAVVKDEKGKPVKDKAGKEQTARFLPALEQLPLVLRQINTSNGLGPMSLYGNDVTNALEAWAENTETPGKVANTQRESEIQMRKRFSGE